MSACPACGAASGGAAQCPRCGAECAGDGALDLALDLDALTRPAAAGVTCPSAAQIGGNGGAAPALANDEPLELSRPLPARPASAPGADWDTRTRGDRLLAWRIARAAVVALLGWFTLSHLALGAVWVFIDNVNLVLHEAGHVLLRWAPVSVYFLGGTIGQLFWPAAFAVYFGWRRRDLFAAGACAWWLFENFMTISIYVADAPYEELPLVGGDIHDWNFLLDRWGALGSAGRIAEALWWLGAVGMVACLALLVRWTWRPPRSANLDY